ncbi:Peptidyl-prolyl cis-trans isomerase FKBP62 [Bienertia sinuspersici]
MRSLGESFIIFFRKEIIVAMRMSLSFFYNMFFDSLASKEVLKVARNMKVEGNSLFELGKFEDALEKYGNAEVILVGYKFEEKVDRTEFWDLSLCIMLNSSACFSKLKEFERVGQVCSIILDFQPNNVKAMYRRAMAAIELGRHEWAYWDLVLAAEISPSNQEVMKRLEEVKTSIHREKSKDQTQGDCLKGLGLGVPPHNKSNEC